MGTVAAIIMIILFLVLMVFVFSAALLTPIIGKKNLFFVIFLGFMVGVVGGTFFVAPVLDDIPDAARFFYQYTTPGTETIGVDVSTERDVGKFIDDAKKIDGVVGVENQGLTLRTTEFSEFWKEQLEKRIPIQSEQVVSQKVYTNGTIILDIKNDSDSQKIAENLSDWLLLIGEIHVRYSVVHVSVNVDASKVDHVIGELSKQDVVITNIEGPIEDKIKSLKEALPNKSNITIFCGFIGILVALAGIFCDTILRILGLIKERILRGNR